MLVNLIVSSYLNHGEANQRNLSWDKHKVHTQKCITTHTFKHFSKQIIGVNDFTAKLLTKLTLCIQTQQQQEL